MTCETDCRRIALLAGKERLNLKDALVEIGPVVIATTQLVKQLAVFNEQDAIGVRCRNRIMRDHHDGGVQLLVQNLKGFKKNSGVARVKRAGGLVGKDQLRVSNDGARRGNALTLTARHLSRVLLQNIRHAKQIGDAIDLRANGISFLTLDGKGQSNVLETGQSVQQVGVLEDEAQVIAAKFGQLTTAQLRDVAAVQDDASAGHGIDSGDAVQKRALARARRAHHADELAFADIERHVVKRTRDGLARAVHLQNVAHGEQNLAAVGLICIRDACWRGCGNHRHGDSYLLVVAFSSRIPNA